MSTLIKIANSPCSTNTFHCVKNANILANRVPQIETRPTMREYSFPRPLKVDSTSMRFTEKNNRFCMHPEKLKQIIKQNDSQIYCSYLLKEAQRKRKRYIKIVQKRSMLLQSGLASEQVSCRYMSTQAKKGNSSLETSDGKDPFLRLNTAGTGSRRKLATKTKTKKKKTLKPLPVFKRTRELSKTCEANMPPEAFLEAEDAAWVKQVREEARKKAEGEEPEPKMNPVKARFIQKRTPSDGYQINNVLTLFSKVKIDSEKHRQKKIKVETEAEASESVNTVSNSADVTVTRRSIKPNYWRRNFSQMCQLQPSYLIRLPKTTPEGYRVLLYAVRDNDPTKMNFSDCVKGFCMYNDCVLSEDGLQEGYIVLFDMRGVQLGHLARVSLPALRCFMLYIQEAHPCRLKAIHILNTATWIHHVMRIVVPLVKSELLNLVQFHKGNVPEGFPLELLPANYGGEAPAVEELDKETKSMVHKYKEWLVETEEWKSDESKRVKKASWWGLFTGSNKTGNVELDEKTILKNLQID